MPGLACQRGAKRRKMQAFLTLALLLARATPAARTLQRFMVNVLLRTPVLGLESHPDQCGSADDDHPRIPAMAGECAGERTRQGGERTRARFSLFRSDRGRAG